MKDQVHDTIAPAAIERALGIYQQMHESDPVMLADARHTLSRKVGELVSAGETDETRLVVGALTYLKALERAKSGPRADGGDSA